MADHSYYTDFKLHNEVMTLRRKVESFESGEIYQRFTNEYEKKLAAKDREINRLTNRLSSMEEKNQLLLSKNTELKGEVFDLQGDVNRLNTWVKEKNELIESLMDDNARKDVEIQRMKALLNTDGLNSGIPTSQTPLNKDKVRPNSRKNTGRPRGGVKGHRKSKLLRHNDEEINDIVPHTIEGNCPNCNGILMKTGKTITKDETDIEVKAIKRRHIYEVCWCPCCGKEKHLPIPNNLKEDNQYGANVQATALSLMNSCNVPINKVGQFLSGITDGAVEPCDGYIAKLQKRNAKALRQFRDDLRNLLIEQPILYWDDTVIMIDKKRGCLRFYGNEKIAWYIAHSHKDMESILQDAILQKLNEETKVMHDHNSINYNKEFIFINLECNVHLIRDLQKVEQILGHTWAVDMQELISSTIHKRKELIRSGITSFGQDGIKFFNDELTHIIERGRRENRKDRRKYYGNEEFTLLNRIEAYKKNYFMWVEDFTLPTSDSLSERALRLVKSKSKISGQFYTETTADYYAIIKSYVETCHRNGINEYNALRRLVSGNPYTVNEIFNLNTD